MSVKSSIIRILIHLNTDSCKEMLYEFMDCNLIISTCITERHGTTHTSEIVSPIPQVGYRDKIILKV